MTSATQLGPPETSAAFAVDAATGGHHVRELAEAIRDEASAFAGRNVETLDDIALLVIAYL